MNGDDSGTSALCVCSQTGEWCSHSGMKVKLSSAAFMHPSRLACAGWINPSVQQEDALSLAHACAQHTHMQALEKKATFTEQF